MPLQWTLLERVQRTMPQQYQPLSKARVHVLQSLSMHRQPRSPSCQALPRQCRMLYWWWHYTCRFEKSYPSHLVQQLCLCSHLSCKYLLLAGQQPQPVCHLSGRLVSAGNQCHKAIALVAHLCMSSVSRRVSRAVMMFEAQSHAVAQFKAGSAESLPKDLLAANNARPCWQDAHTAQALDPAL